LAVTTYALVFNFVAVCKVLKIVRSGFGKPAKITILPLAGTLIMICTIQGIKTYIFENNIDAISLSLLIIIGLFVYLIATYLFEIFFNYGNIQLIREQFKSFV
jgi:hypothetical protein